MTDYRGRDKLAQIVQQIRPLYDAVIYSRKAFSGMVELIEQYEELPHDVKIMAAMIAGDLDARVQYHGENAAIRDAKEHFKLALRYHREAGAEIGRALRAIERADSAYGEKKE